MEIMCACESTTVTMQGEVVGICEQKGQSYLKVLCRDDFIMLVVPEQPDVFLGDHLSVHATIDVTKVHKIV
jgi:hypothetical protein